MKHPSLRRQGTRQPTSEQLLLESSLEQTCVLLSLRVSLARMQSQVECMCGCWGKGKGCMSEGHQRLEAEVELDTALLTPNTPDKHSITYRIACH